MSKITVENVLDTWSTMPAIPPDVLEEYRNGLIDEDIELSRTIERINGPQFAEIDEYFVVGCEKYGYLYVSGCVCYQICLFLQRETNDLPDFVDKFYEVMSRRDIYEDYVWEVFVDSNLERAHGYRNKICELKELFNVQQYVQLLELTKSLVFYIEREFDESYNELRQDCVNTCINFWF